MQVYKYGFLFPNGVGGPGSHHFQTIWHTRPDLQVTEKCQRLKGLPGETWTRQRLALGQMRTSSMSRLSTNMYNPHTHMCGHVASPHSDQTGLK